MITNIDIPIYNTRVAVLVEITEKELQDFYNDNKDNLTEKEYENLKEDIFNNKTISGFTICTDCSNYLIYLKNGKSDNFVSHEIFHVCNMILHDKGVTLDRSSEALAYLIGWFTETYYTLYWEWKDKEEGKTMDKKKVIELIEKGRRLQRKSSNVSSYKKISNNCFEEAIKELKKLD